MTECKKLFVFLTILFKRYWSQVYSKGRNLKAMSTVLILKTKNIYYMNLSFSNLQNFKN